MKLQRMVLGYMLLFAGWAAMGVYSLTDSVFSAVTSLVLFIGACYYFITSILEDWK